MTAGEWLISEAKRLQPKKTMLIQGKHVICNVKPKEQELDYLEGYDHLLTSEEWIENEAMRFYMKGILIAPDYLFLRTRGLFHKIVHGYLVDVIVWTIVIGMSAATIVSTILLSLK